jgi:hypothetical protein
LLWWLHQGIASPYDFSFWSPTSQVSSNVELHLESPWPGTFARSKDDDWEPRSSKGHVLFLWWPDGGYSIPVRRPSKTSDSGSAHSKTLEVW